ncbi:Transcriptional regulatory protein LiaR [Methylophaga muralis]|uniref:Transcriptional regulatory protein LiaR n=1 Tax=Methylophaga muralis TaxID=291169 RepID=A0A1E3GRM1_9GAMM|nr:Transcriptional regulatory protein LiaR [Methylophaga muralis]
MKNEIRILLADDHEVVRSGLARMLERNDDMHIVGEALVVSRLIKCTQNLIPIFSSWI